MHRTVKNVAVVGTGIMGAPIARHLLEAGFNVTVNNRTPEKAKPLLDKGARWADSPAAAAKGADVVLTMVGYPADVEEVYLGSQGILSAAGKGAYLIDLTSSSPELARELSEAAEVMGLHAFDCPVTGGQAGAEAGTLTLILGATPELAAPVLPVLNAFGDKIYYFDRPGAGQAAKLCNQVSLAGAMLGMADAVAFARESGLDEDKMLEMVGSGMGGSRALADLGPKAVEGDWRPGFKVQHFVKDLANALAAAEELDLALPAAQTAYALYDTLAAIGGKDLGTQAIEVLYEPEEDAVAAGLDWSLVQDEDADGHDGCGCGHDHGHDGCGCGHDHGHQCCGGHGHDHGSCGCGGADVE